jgi:hypothetical protein
LKCPDLIFETQKREIPDASFLNTSILQRNNIFYSENSGNSRNSCGAYFLLTIQGKITMNKLAPLRIVNKKKGGTLL